MKKTTLLVLLMLSLSFGFAQIKNDRIHMTKNSLIAEYVEEFIDEAAQYVPDVQDRLLDKIGYIVITPENKKIEGLLNYPPR